jgi:hypothetical protein
MREPSVMVRNNVRICTAPDVRSERTRHGSIADLGRKQAVRYPSVRCGNQHFGQERIGPVKQPNNIKPGGGSLHFDHARAILARWL